MEYSKTIHNALKIFNKNRGFLKTSQAIELGIHPRTLYKMRDIGLIEAAERGLYRVVSSPIPAYPDLVVVAQKVPHGVICLISALAFHDITTQIPHEVFVALKKGSEKPRIKHPPTKFVWFSEASFNAGIQTKTIDGVSVRIYSPEKTVADCFKFRNKIGLDVAIEALKFCVSKRKASMSQIIKYAKICRVEKVMRPYMEMLV